MEQASNGDDICLDRKNGEKIPNDLLAKWPNKIKQKPENKSNEIVWI